MLLARLILAVSGVYLLIRTFMESRLPDGQAMEIQVYIALYAFGAMLLLCGIFLPQICKGFKEYILIRIACILLCGGMLFLAVTAGLIATAPLFVLKADGSEAALLILGAPAVNDQPSLALRSRANLAAEWVSEHPGMQVIVSGGKGGTRTEAETIADLMAEQGTDISQLMLENNAATTEENFYYARLLLDDSCDVATEPIAVLTNSFHIFRMRYLLARQGYGNVRFITAATPSSVRLLWYAREVILTVRFWLTGIS